MALLHQSLVTRLATMLQVYLLITALKLGVAAADTHHEEEDNSPYCGHLAAITQLCNEPFIDLICPKTCSNENDVMQCGVQASPKFRERREFHKAAQVKIEEAHSRLRRIVGGSLVARGGYPWHVALFYKGEHVCSGAIISTEWIITAAHCFDEENTSYKEDDWRIVAGDQNLSLGEGTEQMRDVEKVIVHPRNFKFRDVGLVDVPDDYDAALLKLKTPLQYNTFVAPVCISSPNEHFPAGFDCRISGWGAKFQNGSKRVGLHEATVKLVPHDICNLPVSYNGTIHDRAICAGYKEGNIDACSYDSGGPMVCSRAGRYYLQGLVSWGFACGKAFKYGVYTNVPSVKNWIIEAMLGYDVMKEQRFRVKHIPHSASLLVMAARLRKKD